MFLVDDLYCDRLDVKTLTSAILPSVCGSQEALAATEAEAKKVMAMKEGKLDKDLKEASASREKLSKDLVQATSELTNKKAARDADIKALEAIRQVRFLCLAEFILFFSRLMSRRWKVPCGGGGGR